METPKLAVVLVATVVGFVTGVAVTWHRRPVFVAESSFNVGGNVRSSPSLPSKAPQVQTTMERKLRDDLKDASSKRQQGEYVLDSDIPALRDRLVEHESKVVEAIMSERDGEYAKLFAKLEIDDATSVQLRSHLASIYKAKVRASLALQNLSRAKSDYDKRMEKLLGDNYDLYASYEAAQPARREYSQFTDFLSKSGIGDIPVHEKEVVEKLLQKHEAFSLKTLSHRGGPFEDVPPPVSGRWTIPYVQSRVDTFKQNATSMMSEVRASGLSQTAISALESYFGTQVANGNTEINRANPSTLQIQLLNRTIEQLRSRPNADANEIAGLEARLAKLRAAQPPPK